MDIRYLVFSGGGAAGYAFAGAIQQLAQEPQFSFEKIKAVAGVSSGAIAALAVCLKYTPEEATAKLKTLDMRRLEDGSWLPLVQWYRAISKYGKSTGDYLYDFINGMIKDKTGRSDPQNVTFADLRELGFKDLHIVVTKMFNEDNIPTGKQKVFSFHTAWNTSVADVIRASAAAPIYLKRVRFKKVGPGKYQLDEAGHLFNDGGLLNNIPIETFDRNECVDPEERSNNPSGKVINPHTLALVLLNTAQIRHIGHKAVKSVIKDWKPFEYGEAIFNSLLAQFENAKMIKPENRKRTIQIDRKGVKLGDFNIDEKTKAMLFESGKEGVKIYFNPQSPMRVMRQSSQSEFSEKKVEISTMWVKPVVKELPPPVEMQTAATQNTPQVQKQEEKPKPATKSWCNVM